MKRLSSESFEETEIVWLVKYGKKPMKGRNEKSFLNENDADAFFREKEKAGLYVDVFLEETKTITTLTKLTA